MDKDKNKKGKFSTIIVTLMVFAAAGLLGYKVWNSVRPLSSYISDKSDRNFVYIDLEKEVARVNEIVSRSDEINHEPYSQSSGGGMTYYVSGNGSVTINKDLIKDGKVSPLNGLHSLRTIEDEKVSPNEDYNFNQYVSYRKALNSVDNKKLSKEEVNSYAERLKDLAKNEEHPSWLYIDKLINNLEEKNPTTSSLTYLALANGLSNEGIAYVFGVDLGYVNNHLSLLDRSYKINQDRGLTISYGGNVEIIDETTVLQHGNTNASYTYWGLVDAKETYSNIFPTDKNLDKDIIVTVEHYKDISNDFIAEQMIISVNKNTLDEGIDRAYFTKNKPCFTWCISPKIEEIASAYYDIVEPAVYAGKYTNFEDAYKSTYDVLEGKYTLEEIESAVMTYEFWALCNYD